MEKIRGKDKSMNRGKWKDRNRVYLISTMTGKGYDSQCLVETERSIDRLYKAYKGDVTDKSFIEWMKEMELCKVIEYEEFKI